MDLGIAKQDSCDPYGRPARRTQWIVSTLAYHYGLDRGVENEIIVLATGLDQYLQEIFHHMDFTGDGKIPLEDFNILCEILGLNKDSDAEESVGVLENLPSEFSFRQFHAKLCGYFSTKAGSNYENGRLLVGKDSEHIETQIRLRSPLKRREKLLSPGADRKESRESLPTSDRHSLGCRQLGASCSRECYEEIVALEEAEDRIAKLEDENASLRELVEDMRAALQSSDARSLALQVGLWKSHSKHKPDICCFIAHHKHTMRIQSSKTRQYQNPLVMTSNRSTSSQHTSNSSTSSQHTSSQHTSNSSTSSQDTSSQHTSNSSTSSQDTSSQNTSSQHTSNSSTSSQDTSSQHTSSQHTSSQHTSSQHTSSQHTSSQHTSPRSLQSFLHALDLIRSSRDGQVEEAVLFNQKLEQELRLSQEAMLAMEGCNRALWVEQGEMRRKVEEARQALFNGLGKVKELEAKASRVPKLQRHIHQLEQELQYYR
ncbi:hypothetical protein UPYG_G00092730 [Umbra pygmaea]|uniref:EF-hand domain-containing protein n=1 Tax=Umbra pygmaea TaxID=75934 RepID=A0ABD0Y3L3_UMBPY